MNVLLFGATGMVGQGVLRECLLDPEVDRVFTLGRRTTGRHDGKLREMVQADLSDLSDVADHLVDLDACFFCLGVSAAGMSEASYASVTFDLALAAAELLARQNPRMTFIYVSGAGTDGTGRSRQMWARVKGRTENAILALPFKGYAFRPAFIEPKHGAKSTTGWYQALYVALRPVFPLLKVLFPKYMTSTENVGRAMLEVAKRGAKERILENADIEALAQRTRSNSTT